VLGLLVGSDPSAHALALLGTGFCGGLTTYSAFAVQTRDQGRDRGPVAASAYAVATIALALATIINPHNHHSRIALAARRQGA
jgi:CrcB protein